MLTSFHFVWMSLLLYVGGHVLVIGALQLFIVLYCIEDLTVRSKTDSQKQHDLTCDCSIASIYVTA